MRARVRACVRVCVCVRERGRGRGNIFSFFHIYSILWMDNLQTHIQTQYQVVLHLLLVQSITLKPTQLSPGVIYNSYSRFRWLSVRRTASKFQSEQQKWEHTLLYKCEYNLKRCSARSTTKKKKKKKKKTSTCNASNPSIIHVRGSMRYTWNTLQKYTT